MNSDTRYNTQVSDKKTPINTNASKSQTTKAGRLINKLEQKLEGWSISRPVFIAGLIFSLLVLVLGARHVFAQAGSRVISLTIDGHKQVVSSDAKTVKEVLERDRIVLEPEDLVEPDINSSIDTAVFYINVYRAKPAVVVDGNREIKVNTPYQNPKLIAERSAGVSLNPDDGFRLELIRDFLGTQAVGQRVVVLRSVPIVISVDGRTFEARTLESTVGEALNEKGIKLSEKDTLNVDKATAITPGMHIVVTRVGEEIAAVEEIVARPVRFIYDGNQPTTYEKVQEEGKDGKRLVTYKIVRHNGQEVERVELQSVVEVEAVTRVVVKGTQRTSVAGADWAGLRQCESGGNYANKNNPTYRGAYQFSYSTWAAMGGSGDPADAPPAEQDARAAALYQRSGRGQWPVCGPRYLP